MWCLVFGTCTTYSTGYCLVTRAGFNYPYIIPFIDISIKDMYF